MREEVISSGTVDPVPVGRSASPPPTPAASSAGASSPAVQTNVGSTDWLGSGQGSKAGSQSGIGPQPPKTSLSTNVIAGGSTRGSSQPSCRPWERGDLLCRLATFKPSNWSGKPKWARRDDWEKVKDVQITRKYKSHNGTYPVSYVWHLSQPRHEAIISLEFWESVCQGASSLACARRGWVNVDTDKIECEACGAHLTFPTSASSIPREVDSAGEMFAEKLDAGHKVTCPWKGNCCADSLVQFPPTPPSALVGGYKDRCDGLLQFQCLPVIASSAIETMRLSRGTQIDHFLSQSNTFSSGELGFRADNIPLSEFSREDAFCSYSHAQKLVSLCGWEPRWLPNVQDCEEHSAQSTKNACSFCPTGDELHHYLFPELSKNTFPAPAKKDKGKKIKSGQESRCNLRSPLLDCSLCGATVRILDFLTVPRPVRLGPNCIIGNTDTGKKLVLTRGTSAASGISGWVPEDEEKDRIEDHDEAATTDVGKSLLNTGVDLNLTMAGGLPSTQFAMPVTSGHLDVGGMGGDLIIGQPSGSEVGDRAASYESRGPSTRKRNLEEGGSTVDRPHDRIQHADSIEGTVIDRDIDEVDDDSQASDGPAKRSRRFEIFDMYHSSRRVDSSGAGPSHNLCLDIDIDVNRTGSDLAIGHPSARDSARASSVVAMDTIGHSAGEDSMESVENYPGDFNDVHLPSPSIYRNLDMNDALEPNYSNQAQQSTCVQPAAGSVAREMGGSSTNEGEVILNAETVTAYARDRLSIGISGGSVGMGASHEAEIHGVDISIHRADSVVGEAEPVAEVTENLGQTGESAPGPGLMDEFVPEEMGREDPQGDSQDVMSRSVGKADSGSKVCGSTKADSTESGKKMSHNLGHESSTHPSLSCNAMISCGYDASKEEATQNGKTCPGSDYIIGNGLVPANGENDYEAEAGEFDPIKHHNTYCPWVNGNVAAAGCNINSDSSSSSSVAVCGWQLTLDALDTFQDLGHNPNQTMHSESAASQYKEGHLTPRQKLLTRRSVSKSKSRGHH